MTDFLTMARQAYEQSTSFVDNNYRRQWEDCIRHFQSQHRAGSKYLKQQFQYRAKHFRPKTRSAVRNNEAAAAAAFFSNQDVVSIEAQHPGDQMQQASAEIMRELVQYRLTKTIPWFMTCIGAFQDANVIGVIVSHQFWDYEERTVHDRGVNEITGEEEIYRYSETWKDEPCIELCPVEQIRIHPAASWIDPINTSPYLIHMIPMYVQDVRARMKKADPKTGNPKWKQISDDQIRAAIKQDFDSTRQTRDGNREDKMDQQGKDKPLSDYDVVWVHRNIVRIDGQDLMFYTLGTEHLLCDPKPLHEYYFHCDRERPYVMGLAVIETHKLYPDSLVQLGVPIQTEINENANQRADNVKLVMNKRYTVKSGHNVNLKSLMANVPGGVTLVDDHDDIMEREYSDVTGSSYMEQDRLNLDFDDLVGTFAQGTVQANRKLNETVGGMRMMQGGVNALTEYLVKTFGETWAEPVLRQLIKMEQRYETDQTVLAIAANKAKLFQKYGIDEVTDELLNQELTMTVNVGMGATDPMLKLERLLMAVKNIKELMAEPAPGLNVGEIAKEIFGRLGYKDGGRFMIDVENPEMAQVQAQIQQMEQIIQQLQAQVADKEADRDAKKEIELIKQEAEDDRQEREFEHEIVMNRLEGQKERKDES